MTEQDLALATGVSVRTLDKILADQSPGDLATWKKFAKYFRMNVEFLRTGESAQVVTILDRPGHTQRSAAGHLRKVPLLTWPQMDELVSGRNVPSVIRAPAMLETTDGSGTRTVALKVYDDAMESLFSKGEIFFVNPASKWKSGDYVLATHSDRDSATMLLRQVKSIENHCLLHALNRKYTDLPMTKQDQVWGKVVRLRKNL